MDAGGCAVVALWGVSVWSTCALKCMCEVSIQCVVAFSLERCKGVCAMYIHCLYICIHVCCSKVQYMYMYMYITTCTTTLLQHCSTLYMYNNVYNSNLYSTCTLLLTPFTRTTFPQVTSSLASPPLRCTSRPFSWAVGVLS